MQYTGLISAKADVSSSLTPATKKRLLKRQSLFCI